MVQILVCSDDSNAKAVLEEFSILFYDEYKKQMDKTKMKLLRSAIRSIPPEMPCVIRSHEKGYIVDIPIDIPELEIIREYSKKYLRKELGIPKWKIRLCENLSSYLVKKGIKFSSIEVIE